MTKLNLTLAVVVAAGLFGGAWYWASHPPAYAETAAQVIDHHFVVAAYTVTWVVQLSYLTGLALKWIGQKRAATRLDRDPR
jgi:hypothetical protein